MTYFIYKSKFFHAAGLLSNLLIKQFHVIAFYFGRNEKIAALYLTVHIRSSENVDRLSETNGGI